MPTTITDLTVRDIRFPTSRALDGSDAMNPDPDYSAAYVVLHTDNPAGLEGHGLTFTIGPGNEICVETITNWGLRCLLERNICFDHRRVPAFEGRSQLVIQHLCAYLEQQMRPFLGPAHLLFLDHPLADQVVDR